MTAEHREQMLALIDSLEKEVATVGTVAEENESVEKLRGAIRVTGEVLRQRAAGEEQEGDQDLGERLSELEGKVEIVALEHPVVANVLAAIARLA
jgi:hypothetical protein